MKTSLAKCAVNRQGLTFVEWCRLTDTPLSRNYKGTPFTHLVRWSQAR